MQVDFAELERKLSLRPPLICGSLRVNGIKKS